MQHIFVYGSLQLPEIVKKLTGKSFKTARAVLPGYKLCRVENCDYPAIIKKENTETKGLIIEDVDDESLNIISFYEGDEYKIQKVTVWINEKPVSAIAFVWAKKIDLLNDREWDLQRFKQESLTNYLNVLIPKMFKQF